MEPIGEEETFNLRHVLDQLGNMLPILQQVRRVALIAAGFPYNDKPVEEDDEYDVLAYNRALKEMWKEYYGKMPPEDADLFYDDFPVVSCGETLPAFKELEGLRKNTILQVTKKSVSFFSMF